MKNLLLVGIGFYLLIPKALSQSSDTFIAYLTPQSDQAEIDRICNELHIAGIELFIRNAIFAPDQSLIAFDIELVTKCDQRTLTHKNKIDFSATKSRKIAAIFADPTCLAGSLTTSFHHLLGLEEFLFKQSKPSYKKYALKEDLLVKMSTKEQLIAGY